MKLAQISNEVGYLDADKLASDFKSIYKAALTGSIVQAGALDSIAALLVTADLRKSVLNEVADQLDSELSTLKARQKTLAKKLGQRI